MRRSWTSLAAALAISGFAASLAHGEGWFKKKWNGFVRDAQRNNAWPEAFIPADRASVRQPFNIMVANGWRTQNTLSNAHFAEDSGDLNEAGRLKVQNILTVSPPEYRTIFILRTTDQQETANRLASVYQAANLVTPAGATPSVAYTDISPPTTPSYVVDGVDRSFRASQPVPRLDSGGGGGGMSGGMSSAPTGAGS
ncbi:MAG TPA: hypothetical protein VHZ24_00515 [Pirellulales bacterium]|jgi:hypothetical protein|nr:hypothetical protein [Pirellulales bacterium]